MEEHENPYIITQTRFVLMSAIDAQRGPHLLALSPGKEPCHFVPPKAIQDSAETI